MELVTESLKTRITSVFAQNSLGRAIAHLISGNVISQIIVFAALPVITRIYSPEQMGLLAIYVAILTMIAVVACLRLEIAIPVPKSDSIAANLAALALISSVAIALLIVIVLFLIWMLDVQYLTGHPLWRYAWLFPIGAFFVGLYATAQYWSLRMARYSFIGRTRVTQALVGAGTQITAGLVHIVPLGLMLGHLLMTSAGFIGLFRHAWQNERYLMSEISRQRMKEAFVAYKNFPKFSIVEGLATNGAQQITVLLISTFTVGAEAGFFFLAVRALNAPTALVTNAVSQVYFQRAPEHLRNGTLRQFTRKVLQAIAIVFLPPLLIFGFFAEPIFTLVFGNAWARAGEISVILLPMLIFSLFSASIGMIMNVTGQQKYLMRLKLLGFALRVGAVFCAALAFPEYIVEAYAIASLFVFIAYFIVFYAQSGKTVPDQAA